MRARMELSRLVLLGFAGAAAAIINSVAGGGSIISFPIALAAGLPPVGASATNTVALAPGALASAYAYRKELGKNGRLALGLALPAVLGSLAGAILLVRAPERAFEIVVPWLVLAATLLLLVKDALWHKAAGRDAPPSRQRTLAVAATLGLIAVYGGYFGAGMGIVTLALIALLRRLDIHQMNAIKTIVVGSINTVAAIYFLATSAADLPAAAAMTIGATAGGYAAASVARRVQPRIVSRIVAAIGVALSVVLAVRYWF
jgi:uncharacterized protein